MYYEAELRLLRDTFRKCRIGTGIAELNPTSDGHPSVEPSFISPYEVDPSVLLRQSVPTVMPATIYLLRNSLNCRYICLRLPELPTEAILVIGPYLSAPPTAQQIMEWAESKDVSPTQQKQLEDYYSSLPLLPETSHLFVLLDTFAERLWGANSYSVEDVTQDTFVPPSLLAQKSVSADDGDTLWSMKNMEQR